jgi:hypothetical protein
MDSSGTRWAQNPMMGKGLRGKIGKEAIGKLKLFVGKLEERRFIVERTSNLGN